MKCKLKIFLFGQTKKNSIFYKYKLQIFLQGEEKFLVINMIIQKEKNNFAIEFMLNGVYYLTSQNKKESYNHHSSLVELKST